MNHFRLFLLLVLAAFPVGAVAAEGAEALDWSAWERLPVYEGGRRMPLDTFARSTVEKICGRVSPTLWLPDDDPDDLGLTEARKLFPDGKPRKYTAAELVFSWLVEPEKWERVPMLSAQYKQLREEILFLPLRDAQGRRLRYVALRQVEENPEVYQLSEEIRQRARAAGKPAKPSGVVRKVQELAEAYSAYRLLAFVPTRPNETSSRFLVRLGVAAQNYQYLAGEFEEAGRSSADGKAVRSGDAAAQLLQKTGQSLQEIAGLTKRGRYEFEQVAPLAAALRGTAAALDKQFAEKESPQYRAIAADLLRQGFEMQLALYDSGDTLRLVPALNPGALDAKRPADDDAQPWLSLPALLYGPLEGPNAVLAGYPPREVEAVRDAFQKVKKVYLDRGNPQRPKEFAAAMEKFAAAVRALGEEIDVFREKLPIRNRDESLLAATAYPPPEFTRLELAYNRLDPFFWSWLVSLVSMVCLALSFGAVRKPLFWLGLAVLLCAQALTVGGFALRTYITGLVPLTGMFETVVFAALCVALLGLWFTVLPLIWPGLKTAWRLTAAPRSWEARPLNAEEAALWQPAHWTIAGALLLIPRLLLTGWLFMLLRRTADGRGYFDLWPKVAVGSSLPSVNDFVVWAVGLCVLLAALYYLPRLLLTVVLAAATIPWTLARRGTAAPLQQVLDRKPFALVGAAMAFLVALVAYYAPDTVLQKEIGLAQPILRDNFWLFVHVVTITASYGAGALAWGLSNIALAYYLFGRYRPPQPSLTAGEITGTGSEWAGGVAGKKAPGEVPVPVFSDDQDIPSAADATATGQFASTLAPGHCAKLANFTYKAIQVAVLMLAAGTILGALWADVAWGRFWGWDAKEVWSLISLLAYLLILHGRFIGWFGNFGLAVGSVLGFTSIVMAWYGVNHVLGSGRHAYGSGAGGQFEVTLAVIFNWLFVIAAAVRYNLETRRAAEGP